jgi:hypothetical protein
MATTFGVPPSDVTMQLPRIGQPPRLPPPGASPGARVPSKADSVHRAVNANHPAISADEAPAGTTGRLSYLGSTAYLGLQATRHSIAGIPETHFNYQFNNAPPPNGATLKLTQLI